jgi:hypothetical protein
MLFVTIGRLLAHLNVLVEQLTLLIQTMPGKIYRATQYKRRISKHVHDVQYKQEHCQLSEKKTFELKIIRYMFSHYTKYDIWYLTKFSVVTTLSCSTLIFSSLIIGVRHKCATTFHVNTSFLL